MKDTVIKNIIPIITTILISFILSGCNGQISKQGGGTLIGGVIGGALGSQFGGGEGKLLATGIGAVAGALIGNQIGKTMDEQDQQMSIQSSNQALEFAPSGHKIEWKNPDNGHSGSTTPLKTFKNSGRYCREYLQEVTIGGKQYKAYGTACRQPDGNWEIIK